MIEQTEIRRRQRHRARPLRIPDAVRNPPRPAAPAGGRWLPPPPLCPLRQGVVSILYAAARRAAGQRFIHALQSVSGVGREQSGKSRSVTLTPALPLAVAAPFATLPIDRLAFLRRSSETITRLGESNGYAVLGLLRCKAGSSWSCRARSCRVGGPTISRLKGSYAPRPGPQLPACDLALMVFRSPPGRSCDYPRPALPLPRLPAAADADPNRSWSSSSSSGVRGSIHLPVRPRHPPRGRSATFGGANTEWTPHSDDIAELCARVKTPAIAREPHRGTALAVPRLSRCSRHFWDSPPFSRRLLDNLKLQSFWREITHRPRAWINPTTRCARLWSAKPWNSTFR